MSQSRKSDANSPKLEITASRQLTAWMAEQELSLAFTTYQTGKLFLIGLQPNGRLSIFERTFNRCMGLWASDQTLWMSSLFQLWRFENLLQPGQLHNGYDRLFVPRLGYVTGDLDIHDVAVDVEGRVLFVNTLFSCLATVSETHSFRPVWTPSFISKLAAEDRCHMNGLALENGKSKYVCSVSQADVADGWRDHRENGGCVIDVDADEIIAAGLSMPHSVRVHEGKVWLLNSGTGEFGFIDVGRGSFEPVAFCPGYLRGLAFHGPFVVVGLSKSRKHKTFSGLQLDERLARAKAEPRCALYVIDTRTGSIAHWLRMEGIVEELYDVVVLPGVQRPMALGFVSDEVRRMISLENG